MTTKITLAFTLTLMCFTLVFSAYGVEIQGNIEQYKLQDAEVSKLNDGAKKAYEAGVEFLDRVMYDRALKSFIQASAAQPDHPGLKFIVARLATYQGRIATQDSGSDEYLTQARDVYTELKDMKNLSMEQKETVANELRMVEFLIRSQEERDKRRSRLLQKNLDKQIPEPKKDKKKDAEGKIILKNRELERVL